MTELVRFTRFRRRYLALTIGLMMLPTAHAMQELSDHSLSDTTGEGVALVLDDFKIVMQAPNDLSTGSSYALGLANPSQYDTGFIRIIPTGENYQQMAFNQVYQSAYKNQYQISYNSIYTSKRSQEYNRVISTEQSAAYNELNTTARINEYRTFESDFSQSGSYAQQRKAYWVDEYSGRWWTADRKEREAQAAAERDVQNNLATVVQDRIRNEANALGAARASSQAEAYALNQVNLHANQQIRNSVNSNVLTVSITPKRTKADVFIYGLALSKSDGNLNTRFSNQGFSWGSSDNPWLFRAGIESGVEQFYIPNNAKDIGYLALEAPLTKKTVQTNNTVVVDDADNNIKLGFWADLFARDYTSSSQIDPKTGAPISGLDNNYRLRGQVVANGLSLNGSQVRMFQTLGPDIDNPLYQSIENEDFYHTLGLAGLIRINTNDNPATLKFATEKNLTGSALTTAQNTNKTLDAKGLRISTATLNDLDSVKPTPAMQVGLKAPIFQDREGLYLYSPNINLVLGNMYQPFVLGSEGNNIVLEVTRIPNISSIYNKIYQNYSDGTGSNEFKGSTCNVYQCGTELTIGTTTYQGRDATHSSIAIGTVGPKTTGNFKILEAKSTADATGVVFKGASGASSNLGSALIDGVLIQHLKIRTTGL